MKKIGEAKHTFKNGYDSVVQVFSHIGEGQHKRGETLVLLVDPSTQSGLGIGSLEQWQELKKLGDEAFGVSLSIDRFKNYSFLDNMSEGDRKALQEKLLNTEPKQEG